MYLHKIIVNIPVALYVTSETKEPAEVGEAIDKNQELIQEEIVNNYNLSEIKYSISEQLAKGEFKVNGSTTISNIEC